jgi:hypothetical protein
MKRSLRTLLVLALALAVATTGVFADTIGASFNKINISVNGTMTAVSGESFVRTTGDVPYSILYKGTTYLPLAKVCEFVGKAVSWDGDTRTVFIENPASPMPAPAPSDAAPGSHQDVTIDCVFDSLTIAVNGQTFARPGTQFDRGGGQMVPYSLLYRGTTYLPLAAVCQIVGKDISWDGANYIAAVKDRALLSTYGRTEVPDFGQLCGLPLSEETTEDDIMVYNYYQYTETDRAGRESEDLQRYVGYLFEAGYRFSLEDSRAIMGSEATTLYAYRSEATRRVVVIGIARVEDLSLVTVSYTK